MTRKKKVLLTLATIMALLVLAVVFFVPLNNGIRNATGQDTPTDTIVKDELVKKVKANKTGDTAKDEAIDKSADALKKTKMSSIMKAAKDEAVAARLIQQSSSLSESASKRAAHILFTDDQYQPLRDSMSQGNYVSMYQQYRNLSGSGALLELKQQVNQ